MANREGRDVEVVAVCFILRYIYLTGGRRESLPTDV